MLVKESLSGVLHVLILIRICDVHLSIDCLMEVAWFFFMSHDFPNDLKPKSIIQGDVGSGEF